MEDIAKLIPNSIASLIGLAVIMGVLIMLGTFFQELAKRMIRNRNGGEPDERRRQSDEWLDQFVKTQKEYVESNKNVVDELRSFSETVEKMATSMNQRAKAAMEQHEEIIDKIDGLDVPRKTHRY